MKPGTLWVLEQIPGYIESADVTSYLSLGYWPSYNVPFFPYIYEISGFPKFYKKYGNWFSYDANPRAMIFRRDHSKVTDFSKMKWIMQYNDWEHDPYSQGNPGNAISSRFDLVKINNSTNPNLDNAPFGGIDSKVTSYHRVKSGTCEAISGPSHDQVPAFDWNEYPGTVHAGQPEYWRFSFEKFSTSNI